MTTYGRFACVERSIMMWLLQDFEGPSELIVYNTDAEYPLVKDSTLLDKNIITINNNIDMITQEEYTNVGAIRRDAVSFATGEYYICWDDDDIFLPWNNRQCMDGILRHPDAKAFKPMYSLFETPAKLEQARNTLEASIIVHLQTIREIGFRMENGSEHLDWYTKLSYGGQMIEDEYSIPGYSYRWNDPDIAGHKQSGRMGAEDGFTEHKNASQDRATRPLTLQTDQSILHPYYEYFRSNIDGKTSTPNIPPTYPPNFHPELIDKYVRQYL